MNIEYLKEDKLYIICPKSRKYEILENVNCLKHFYFLDIYDFIEQLTFSIKKEAYLYLYETRKIIPSIADKYFDLIAYIDIYKGRSDDKFKFLVDLYNDLNEHGFIYKNNLIDNIGDYKVVFDGYEDIFEVRFCKDILDKCGIEHLNNPKKYSDELNIKDGINVYEFNSEEDEARFVFQRIHDLLINDKISPNKIKIANYNEEYEFAFKRLANFYNYKINFPASKNILGSNNSKKVLECLENNGDLEQTIKHLEESSINNKIANVFNDSNALAKDKYGNNKYSKVTIIEYVKYAFKDIYFDSEKYEDGIELVDAYSYSPSKDEYIFFISANSDTTPRIVKEDGYFTNQERKELGFDSYDYLNKILKNQLITNINNMISGFISFKNSTKFRKYFPSSLIASLKDHNNTIKTNYKFGINEKEDTLEFALALERYKKFGEKDESNNYFNNFIFDAGYNSFDYKFSGISKETMDKYFPSVTLSPTSLEEFYKCPFRFYSNRVLGLELESDKMGAHIGEAVHLMFENLDQKKNYSDQELDTTIEEAIKTIVSRNKSNAKEEFFIRVVMKIAKDAFKYNYERLKDLDVECNINDHEANIEVDLIPDKLKFTGKIDNQYKDIQNNITIITDYKTGIHGSINEFEHRLGGQLAYYAFMILSDKSGNNSHKTNIGGMFYQEINKTSNFHLTGIGIDNISNNTLGNFIKKNQQTLNGFNLDKLYEYTKNTIIDAYLAYKDGNFAIQKIKCGKISSCLYCSFYSMCHNDSNYEKKNTHNKFDDFIGGL